MKTVETKKDNQKLKRLPRYRRVAKKDAPNMIIQERDLEILKTIWNYRFLTTDHIRALIPGTRRKIYERLKKLYHHHYLDRLYFPIQLYSGGSQKAIYVLDNLGADLLVEKAGFQRERVRWTNSIKNVQERYLKHALMISNFRVIITLALSATEDVKLLTWRQGREIKDEVEVFEDGNKVRHVIVPDAMFAIREEKEREGEQDSLYFVECDRSTMTSERYLRKMKGYWHYFRSGKSKERYGVSGFRVLTITLTDQRRENLLKVTKKADEKQVGSGLYLFTSEPRFTLKNPRSVLDPIWRTPNSSSNRSIID